MRAIPKPSEQQADLHPSPSPPACSALLSSHLASPSTRVSRSVVSLHSSVVVLRGAVPGAQRPCAPSGREQEREEVEEEEEDVPLTCGSMTVHLQTLYPTQGAWFPLC